MLNFIFFTSTEVRMFRGIGFVSDEMICFRTKTQINTKEMRIATLRISCLVYLTKNNLDTETRKEVFERPRFGVFIKCNTTVFVIREQN